jgi:hypothetical protein
MGKGNTATRGSKCVCADTFRALGMFFFVFFFLPFLLLMIHNSAQEHKKRSKRHWCVSWAIGRFFFFIFSFVTNDLLDTIISYKSTKEHRKGPRDVLTWHDVSWAISFFFLTFFSLLMKLFRYFMVPPSSCSMTVATSMDTDHFHQHHEEQWGEVWGAWDEPQRHPAAEKKKDHKWVFYFLFFFLLLTIFYRYSTMPPFPSLSLRLSPLMATTYMKSDEPQ